MQEHQIGAIIIMKKLIVYYSLEGNTEFVTSKISKYLEADVIRLVPKKDFPKGNITKYIWGGKSATFGEKPKLEEYSFVVDDYDVIIIGTPIWAGTFSPPIKTFLADNKISGKNIYLFTCSLSGVADKCIEKLKGILKDNRFVDTINLVEPLKNTNDNIDEKIKAFCEKIKNK